MPARLDVVALLLLACSSEAPAPAALPDAGQADTAPDAAPDAEPDVGDGCVAPPGSPDLDEWGGDRRVAREATGFFRLTRLCGRDWLVTPGGHPFYSLGVNTVGPRGSAGRESGERTLVLLVPTLLGLAAGEWLHRRVPARLFAVLLFSLLLVAGVLLASGA